MVNQPDTSDGLITGAMLRESLLAWWHKGVIAPDLLDIITPETDGKHAISRSLTGFKYLYAFCGDYLAFFREAARITVPVDAETLHQVRDGIAQDFSVPHMKTVNELATWSAVYHHYFIPFQVPQEALAAWSGMSTRNLRRYKERGLARLALVLNRSR